MDFSTLNIFTSFIVPLFLVFLHWISKTLINYSSSQTQNKLPPGPRKFPLIGNLPHFFGSQPHHAVRDLAKKYGPIIHLQLGEISTVVISSAPLAKVVFKTHDLALANRPEFYASRIIFYNNSDIAFAPYGKHWRQMRKICILELFSAKKVRSFKPLREEEVSYFINNIRRSSQSPINLGRMIYSLNNSIACRVVFGKRYKLDKETLIDLILEVVLYLGGFDVANLFPSFKFLANLTWAMSKVRKVHQKLDKILDQIIDEHIKNPMGGEEEDLVDVLLRLKEKDGLELPIDFNSIKAVILEMFSAGTETSSTTIEWAMSELIRNPRVMEKVQAEVKKIFKGKKEINETDLQDCSYLKMVIKETLRLHNPFPLLAPRECREECEIEGYKIPVKTNIIINFAAIARDPEHWHDPENFLPERFENLSIDFKGTNFEYIPFGGGRRMCPGILFGMASIGLVLAQLLYYFDWKLMKEMKPEDLDMSEVFGITVRRKNSLHVIATPHSSL